MSGYVNASNLGPLCLDVLIKSMEKDISSLMLIFNILFKLCAIFFHKWDKAAMASSVKSDYLFLDKNVYLYLLSLPLEKKIKGGNLKSILKDSFEDIF